MRSALLCVFFALIVQKEGSRAEQDDDFKPTPIPLDNWPSEKQEPAGTLHEFIKTDAPPTVAALPAHYWEDALRHSVYLTLVRDKIDQLIAKGTVISPDSKPENNISKEIDDHDLWEKIKAAPFDRIKENPLPPGDVIILARGRLLEEKDGYRFAEDDAFPDKCTKDYCTQAVKAYWSVKRVRQGETSPGKYHYELTFSVSSQAPKKLKKPYENPVRTFTIRENNPTEQPPPQARRNFQHQIQSERSQRAVWVHKNINPSHNYQKRPASSRGLDRIFSSLFSDDDSYEDAPYRRKPNTYIPHTHPQQHSKIGYVGDRESYHQKKVAPYPIKSQPFRYSRPPMPPPPLSYMQQPYLDGDQGGFNPHTTPHVDNRYVASNPIKTTKPAVLPTPITNFQLLKESTVDVPVKTTLNATDHTTKEPDIVTTTYKVHSHKQSPMKVSYFPENIRPPIYNAPPGVFVTMDKKPFKPMPPLKLMHSSKPHKTMPLDFRPSPQILDTSYSDTDSSADNAFRPMTLNLTELFNSKKGPKNNRKPAVKKPHKKHENIKTYRLTTVSPDIITASESTELMHDELDWAEILGSFTKTTPMASERERVNSTDNDFVTTTTASPTTTTEKPEEATTTSTTTSTTTTTSKPRRTRPPPKFSKPDKIKKHKRITTTTTSTTTTTTTAKPPTRKYPVKKPSDDLTPQASSAATSGANSVWETKHKGALTNISSTTTTTSTTSTSTTPTTSKTTTTTKLITTASTPSTTASTEPTVGTTQPRSKNRFRQSTLMQKGTSVNHDKWSSSTIEKNRTIAVSTNKYPLRRKASKFQGYIPSSTPRQLEKERNKEDHEDHGFSFNKEHISSTTVHGNENVQVKTPSLTQTTVTDQKDSNGSPSEWNHDDDIDDMIEVEEEKENDVQESKDDSEYIFSVTSGSPNDVSEVYNHERPSTTEQTVVASPYSTSKNKTKCKKKKHHNLTDSENLQTSSDIEITTVVIPTSSISTTSTTTNAATPDIFDELFAGFTMDDVSEKPQSTAAPEPSQSESAKHEQYIPIDDDIEDFLHSLDQKDNQADEDEEKIDDEYDEENDDEDSPFNNEEDNLDSRNLNDEYYEENSESHADESQDRPYSLLELMAME